MASWGPSVGEEKEVPGRHRSIWGPSISQGPTVGSNTDPWARPQTHCTGDARASCQATATHKEVTAPQRNSECGTVVVPMAQSHQASEQPCARSRLPACQLCGWWLNSACSPVTGPTSLLSVCKGQAATPRSPPAQDMQKQCPEKRKVPWERCYRLTTLGGRGRTAANLRPYLKSNTKINL